MMMKKRFSLLICMMLVLTMLAACTAGKTDKENKESDPVSATKKPDSTSEAAGKMNPTGMPIMKEPITIKMFAGKPPASTDWKELMLWKEYEKMTNIHIDWVEQVPFANLAEKRNLTLANGDYPEAFYTSYMPATDLIRYGGEGAFLKLNDLIDDYAPNLKELFDKFPDVKKAVTMPDGNIYTVPTIIDPEFTSARTGGKIWLNQKWLEVLGIAEPKTTDDFYNMLKMMKEKDFNENGKSDEVPFASVGIDGLLGYLKGAWGLGNRGVSIGNVDMDPDGKGLRFIPADPRYKEVLQFVNKLYTEKLISEDIFTTDYAKFIAEGSKGAFGSIYGVDPTVTVKQEGFIGSPALTGPHGDQLYAAVTSPLIWMGGLVLTDKNENPEATIRWLDYFYGEEGSRMFFMGFEGVTYNKADDGKLVYVDDIKNNKDGLNLDQAVSRYLSWPGGGYAGVVSQKYFQGAEGSEASIAATKKLEPYFPKEIWPYFSFTVEENDQMAALGADIEVYTAEMQAKFITGKVPFTEWDDYVSKLNKMGLKDYLGIYNAAYERYKQ
ncbi:extracellular solute-binding protein [Paenibacillus eucommiae]|uniref:Aldouronate transport system substrate-binding protein n=1 Tax=Paenibacillus eucommiae TaxID=1355755 RepID=A0ABS4J1G1_9BACL|nr:extracellular solute-binding protein [Paenibacillus eucommiae]MBP1993677.1 putative aldouronate transport system substrate-binding protein [Paenibacillus eucommiae]